MPGLKLCILAAGKGTRIAAHSNVPHKALIPLQGKAVISHILEKFSKDMEVVVALGYEAALLREYLEAAHPDRKFQFVQVQNYASPGSGPGQSLLECQPFLTSPFVLACADTLWEENLAFHPERNQIFVATANSDLSEKYCNVLYTAKGEITEIRDKVRVGRDAQFASFIGLATISDAELFFEGLTKNSELIAGELQISSGFQALVAKRGCTAVKVNSWLDTGCVEGLQLAERKFGTAFFKKRSEETYFVGSRVIKFYADSEICRMRILRSLQDQDILPPCVYSGNNFYAYTFIPGTAIRDLPSIVSFEELLQFAKQFIWKKRENPADRHELCRKFYIEKTKQRLELFREQTDTVLFSRLENMFSLWKMEEFLEKASLARFHGDFQVGNIISTEAAPHFALIDFRQEFAGRTDLGDIYYDLGKLFASIWIDFISLAKAKTVEELHPKPHFASLAKSIEDFAKAEKLDFLHIKKMALLIYLNMIGLHEKQTSEVLAHKLLELNEQI